MAAAPRARLTDVILQDLALVTTNLARPLELLVADGEGGEADGGQGELGTLAGEVWRRRNHGEHTLGAATSYRRSTLSRSHKAGP